jgi:hypothetical protein
VEQESNVVIIYGIVHKKHSLAWLAAFAEQNRKKE